MTDEIETNYSQLPADRVSISFLLNVTDAGTIGEALDVAALTIGRYGLDSLYVLVTNPDTGDQFVVNNGEILTIEDAEAALVNTVTGDEITTDEPPVRPDGD